MNDINWVMYAGMVSWAGVGLYLLLLAKKQNTLSRRIEQIATLVGATTQASAPKE